MENEAARLRAGADALSAAKDVVFAALAAVEAEEVAQAEKKAADSEVAAVGSALTASLRTPQIAPHQHGALQERHARWARRPVVSCGLCGDP